MALGEDIRDTAYHAVDVIRTDHGRWPLTRVPDIAWNAGLHAGWMRRSRRFEHASWDLLGDLRENIWLGQGRDPFAATRHAIHAVWMAHDGHRWNVIDDRLSQMGIGVDVLCDEMRGLYVVTLVYRARG